MLLAFPAFFLQAQDVPQGISYQAVARDGMGNEMANASITLKISILSGSSSGTLEYSELHAVTTNRFGLFTLVIGEGSFREGRVKDFSQIAWNQPTFLKVEMQDGSDWIAMGTSQFFSVPYALYSGVAASSGSGGNSQILSIEGHELTISGGNTVILPDRYEDADANPFNELQNLSLEDKVLSISGGNAVTLNVADADADSTNELQDLRLVGNKLRITDLRDPTYIDLGPYLDNTDAQTLHTDGNRISISGGNQVVADTDTTNELQSLSLDGTMLSISQGNTIDIASPKVAFRAKKESGTIPISAGDSVTLIWNNELIDINDNYDVLSGVFKVPSNGGGTYVFNIIYSFADNHTLKILVNNNVNETIFEGMNGSLSGVQTFQTMLELNPGDEVAVQLNASTNTFCKAGIFSGYKLF